MEKQEQKTEKPVVNKKQQKASVSYSLKAINSHVKVITDAELLSKEEAQVIIDLKNKAVNNYILKEFEF